MSPTPATTATPLLSTASQKVIHWAHSWVILTLQVRLPFRPLRVVSFPIMARLYRKPEQCPEGPLRQRSGPAGDEAHPFRTRGGLVLDMMRTLADWLVGREFELLVDGAYPSEDLLKGLPGTVKGVSRIRSDAALYAPPPLVEKRGPGHHRHSHGSGSRQKGGSRHTAPAGRDVSCLSA